MGVFESKEADDPCPESAALEQNEQSQQLEQVANESLPQQQAPPTCTADLSTGNASLNQRAPDARSMTSRRRSSGANFPVPGTPDTFNDDDSIPVAEPTIGAEQPEPDPAVSSDAILSVNTRVEYSALPRGQTQDVFGLVTVQAAAAPEPEPSAVTALMEERQPMDLVCVLDVSGSMQGDKIRQVQDAMRFIIDQALPKDRLSIVAFNREASRVLRLRKMDAEGKNDAIVATLRLAATGGTSIAAGLSTALSVIEQRRQRNKVSAMLLLTDGQDGSTRSRLPALIARAQQANCSVYPFGFGSDHDAALLSELAEQAQTPFTFVEDTENIREAFAGAVGGLSSIVAQQVNLTIACRVPLKTVHTPFTTQRTSDTEAVITIPDLFAGERRDILVELAVPAGGDVDGQTMLLQAHVRYTDLRSGCLVQTNQVAMEASLVEEPQPEAEPDQEVSAQRERVEVTRALHEATAQSDRGCFDEAQRVLDAAEQRMKSSRTRTHLSEALSQEIADAHSRMRSRSVWEDGGRAEVNDARQMHSMQRATNMLVSTKSSVSKTSKKMYCNSRQVSSINASKASSSLS